MVTKEELDILMREKKYNEIINNFKGKDCEPNQQYLITLYVARALHFTGNLVEAEEHYLRLCTINNNPNDLNSKFGMADIYCLRDECDKAMGNYQQLIEEVEENRAAEIYFNASLCLSAREEYQRALDFLNKFFEIKADANQEWESLLRKTRLMFELGQYAGARLILKQCLVLETNIEILRLHEEVSRRLGFNHEANFFRDGVTQIENLNNI
jgi:tetratricopeptide (TPR) repeat protein